MYSLKNALLQSPEKVKITVLSVLGVVAGVRGWDPSLLETVGVGIAIERSLELFYVAPARGALNDAQDAAATTETLKGIELGKTLATTRPLRANTDPAVK